MFESAIDLRPELLIVFFEQLEVVDKGIQIHASVGDDVAVVVWITRCILNVHAHDPSNELQVRREASIRPEDRCDTELRMVESLAEHLDVDDDIKFVAA